MKVDKELIKRVADNAKLSLTDKEINEFVAQLKDVLEHFSKIAEVDTGGIEQSIQPVGLKNVLREDRIEKSLSQEEALANTEHKKDGYFKGPKAI